MFENCEKRQSQLLKAFGDVFKLLPKTKKKDFQCTQKPVNLSYKKLKQANITDF